MAAQNPKDSVSSRLLKNVCGTVCGAQQLSGPLLMERVSLVLAKDRYLSGTGIPGWARGRALGPQILRPHFDPGPPTTATTLYSIS
jgi:hypothetical protein